MTATAESLLHQALKLSDQDRSELVDQLAESIGPEPALSDEEKSTLDRRWDDIVSGKVKCRDAFEVLADIEARLREKIGTAS